MIKPTVGRVVLIFFAGSVTMQGYALPMPAEPVPALIARVHSDTCINAAAFDVNGHTMSLTSVRLLQDGDERPTTGYWAEWMPYQVGQAKKHDSEVARGDTPKAPPVDNAHVAPGCEQFSDQPTADRPVLNPAAAWPFPTK